MGRIKQALRVLLGGQGSNPNSQQALMALNAERRAMARAKREPEPLSPPPAAPTPAPRAQPAPVSSVPMASGPVAEFFNGMQMYEKWRMEVYDAEQRKRDGIAQAVEQRLRKELEGKDGGEESFLEDPLVKEAVGVFISKIKEGGVTSSSSVPSDPSPPSGPASTPVPSITQEQADEIADQIEDAFPDLCAQARRGEITRDEAISKIVQGGAKPEDASIIYQSIMDVET